MTQNKKTEKNTPKYPIYVLSKSRYDYCYTMKALEKMNVDYRVVVEPQEYEQYAKALGEHRIIELPFSNHGKGSGPARNFCWEHSIKEGHERHWVLDDNIFGFYRYHHNKRVRIYSGAAFRSIEDFVDRYTNVALAGPQYRFFCSHNSSYKSVMLNSRLMSCILIKNDLDFRWRARYNEDVDLSLRALKAGYTTMLFYHMLQDKAATLTVPGGNTTEIYGGGTYDKSKMLAMLHPDCVELVERYGRYHHHVDLRHFQHIMPKLKDDFVMPQGTDEYDLVYAEGYGTDELTVTPYIPRTR